MYLRLYVCFVRQIVGCTHEPLHVVILLGGVLAHLICSMTVWFSKSSTDTHRIVGVVEKALGIERQHG